MTAAASARRATTCVHLSASLSSAWPLTLLRLPSQSLTAPRDSTTGEVNLAWAAIHGNPDFAGKAFHDEPFDDGDEAAISHADRYMPDTPSTEMHAMASFTFAESHALVDLQEQIVIESARGWQRVSRVQFEASKYGSGFFHVPGQGNLLGVNAKTGFGIGRSSASGKPEVRPLVLAQRRPLA